jgi:hypothetical protein
MTKDACGECDGRGWTDEEGFKATCPTCRGSGEAEPEPVPPAPAKDGWSPMPEELRRKWVKR